MKYANPLRLTLKGLKTWNTNDGGGYQFTLYADGKRIAEVTQDGHGGETSVHPFNEAGKRAMGELAAFVQTLPKETFDTVEIDVGVDMYLEELLAAHELEQKLARARKKSVLFVLTGEDPTKGYRTLNTLDQDKARAYLDKKFPGGYTLL